MQSRGNNETKTLNLNQIKIETGNMKQEDDLGYSCVILKDLTNGKDGIFFFDSDRGYLYKVSKTYKLEWTRKTEKFITVKLGTIGIINNQRKIGFSRIKAFLSRIRFKQGQSLISSLSSMITSIFSIIEKIKNVAESKHLLPMILDISSLLIQAMSPTYSNWTPSYLLGHLLRFYSLYIRGKAMVHGETTTEALTLATLSLLLPPPLLEIIKRMNLFTSKKILDTPSAVLDCISGIIEFFIWCLKQIPMLPEFMRKFIDSLSGFSTRALLLRKMCDYKEEYNKCKAVMIEESWREKVKALDIQMKENEDLQQYFKTSPLAVSKYKDFTRLVKSLEAFEKCSRREPVALIFEGPPGTRKSFIMSNLIDSMNKSVYTHVVKAVSDGKDFYDTYNNEEIFAMDDVGQQSVNQWRTIINMVSTIKLPLDCAAVELKDMKYFNSEYIMCTTNHFSQLTGLTKSDGISDIKALWRRCHVFNFDNVSIVNDELKGFVKYTRFCPYENVIKNSFPFETKIPVECRVENKQRLVAWMNIIAEKLSEHYTLNYNSNQLTNRDKKDIEQLKKEFENMDYEDATTEDFFSLEVLEDDVSVSGEGFFSKLIGSLSKTYYRLYFNFLQALIFSGLQAAVYYIADAFRSREIAVIGGVNGGNVDFYASLASIGCCLILSVLITEWLHNTFDTIDNAMADLDSVPEESFNSELMCKWKKASGQSFDNCGTMVDSVSKRMMVVEVIHQEGSEVHGNICQALISGHYILGPQHAFKGKIKGILNAYKDWDHYKCDSVSLNNIPYEVVYENMSADLVIAKLPTYMLSPFKNCKDYFKTFNKTNVAKTPAIVTPGGAFKANRNFNIEKKVLTYTTYREHVVDPGQYIEYSGFTSPGLSGSLIVDPVEGIVGMHVAGDSVNGNAIIYPLELRKKIYKILADDNFTVDVESKETLLPAFSGSAFQTELYKTVPAKSSIQPSPLNGVFETTKRPANLAVYGVKTVEKMAEKSFMKIPPINEEEIEYAGSIISIMVPEFKDITDKEIVKGNNILAPLNKKSVNGFGLEKEKEHYIDFEEGVLKPETVKLMEDLEVRVKAGTVDIEDLLYYETLKDELRLAEKVDKPRSFRVCRLPIILWQKKIFGDLFQQILETSDFNQISLGTNPYKDWDKYYKELTKMELVFDIDIKTFDGKQSAQMQDLVNRVVLSKYKGNHPEMAAFLLEMIVRSWVLVRNKLFVTTHSLPSGVWLTGLFNSLYNRGYSACSFARECRKYNKIPRIVEFFSLLDRVCGDDKLCGAPKGLTRYFNAKTVGSFFNSIGMTATTGTKGEIVSEGMPIEEVSFLKRKFVYHNELQKVMGPLDKETLLNSIQWFDSTKDMDEVMQGKLNSFQREMYLHQDGQKYVDLLKDECKKRNVPFPLLSKDYIKQLYLQEPDEAYRLYISDNDKNYFY